MPEVLEIHNPKHDVYHNNSECPERALIKERDLRFGTGGKTICPICDKLNKEGK